MFTISELVDIAVRIEKNGENVYRDASTQTRDNKLKGMLTWLADQEAKHHRWFTNLGQRLRAGKKKHAGEKIAAELYNELLDRWTFSLDEEKIPRIETLESLLAVSTEFEKDTILFYELLATFIEDAQTQAHLKEIIREEKRHIEDLKAFGEATELDLQTPMNV